MLKIRDWALYTLGRTVSQRRTSLAGPPPSDLIRARDDGVILRDSGSDRQVAFVRRNGALAGPRWPKVLSSLITPFCLTCAYEERLLAAH